MSSPSLPVELSSFAGRSAELSEIRRLLRVAHAITLTGPGGIGKTRLAVRAARELAHAWRDLTRDDAMPDELTTVGRFLRLPQHLRAVAAQRARARRGERRVHRAAHMRFVLRASPSTRSPSNRR